VTSFWLPDTTVFRSFEAGGRLEWLKLYLGASGRWTEVIADEVGKSLGAHPGLSVVFTDQWFPEPESARDTGELNQIDRFRRAAMGGDPGIPTQHLGESETFVIMRNRAEFADSFFVTDDQDAFEVFRGQRIRVEHTLEILKKLVSRYECTDQEAFDFYGDCLTAGRHFIEYPDSKSYFSM
jgi:hypothetical protein